MVQMPDDFQAKLADAATRLMYACSQISEDFYTRQTMLSGNMLIDSMNEAMANLNPRTLSDVEFAFNDVESLTQELPPPELEWFQSPFNTIRSVIKELGFHVSLPEALVEKIRALRGLVAERLDAVDRASFRPPGYPEEPLPNDPTELQSAAEAIRGELEAAGYDTPLLDQLAANPAAFDNLDCSRLTEELDVILG